MRVMAAEQCTTLTVVSPTAEIVDIYAFDKSTGEGVTDLYRGKTYHIVIPVENTSGVSLKVKVKVEIRGSSGVIKSLGEFWTPCISPGYRANVEFDYTVEQDVCTNEEGIEITAEGVKGALCDGTEFTFSPRPYASSGFFAWDYLYSVAISLDPSEIYVGQSFTASVTVTNNLPAGHKTDITVVGHLTIDDVVVPDSTITIKTSTQASKSLELESPDVGTHEVCFVIDEVHY